MRKPGFIPIALKDYVELHLRANPGTDRTDLEKRLRYAMDASSRGARCHCGEAIWIIGSAVVGFSCFTCITGESTPDNDYEIVADLPSSHPPRKHRRKRHPRLAPVVSTS